MSIPHLPNLCMEALVVWVGKTWIFIECSCLIACKHEYNKSAKWHCGRHTTIKKT